MGILISLAALVLSVLDIFSSLVIIFPSFPIFSPLLVFYLALFLIAKGFWSITTSIAGGFYFDFMGGIDLIAGVVLFLMYSGVALPFWIFGIILLLKGIYSALFSL